VDYDLLDAAPDKRFIPVTIQSEVDAPSTLSLSYDAHNVNQWTLVTLNVGTSLGAMIYTRFLRFEFARKPGGLTFPYSIEVRNLRIGRNVAP
jgi:hypothetical protein